MTIIFEFSKNHFSNPSGRSAADGPGLLPDMYTGRFPEEQGVLEELKEFAHNHVANHAGLFHPQAFPSDLFRMMGERGLLGAPDLVSIARGSALLASESGSLGFAAAWATQSLIPLVLDQAAGLPEEVKAGVSTGDTIIALAVSEPKVGAHPKYLGCRATRITGGWLLDGEKAYVTNGPIASHVAVLAITDSCEGRKAFSCFLVPAATPGLTRVDHPQLDYLRPAQHCGFRLQDCQLPESALIGQPGKGYEDIALPFRRIEDMTGASALIAVLGRAARQAAQILGPRFSDETGLVFGELAGIETTLEMLNEVVFKALEAGSPEMDAASLHLIAIHDLARRYIELVRGMGIKDDSVQCVLHDVEKYLDIARMARQTQKARLGQSYFIPVKDFSGKNVE
jgi:acyl-CoA dehydrogenase